MYKWIWKNRLTMCYYWAKFENLWKHEN